MKVFLLQACERDSSQAKDQRSTTVLHRTDLIHTFSQTFRMSIPVFIVSIFHLGQWLSFQDSDPPKPFLSQYSHTYNIVLIITSLKLIILKPKLTDRQTD